MILLIEKNRLRDEIRDLVRTKANMEMIPKIESGQEHDPKQKNQQYNQAK